MNWKFMMVQVMLGIAFFLALPWPIKFAYMYIEWVMKLWR